MPDRVVCPVSGSPAWGGVGISLVNLSFLFGFFFSELTVDLSKSFGIAHHYEHREALWAWRQCLCTWFKSRRGGLTTFMVYLRIFISWVLGGSRRVHTMAHEWRSEDNLGRGQFSPSTMLELKSSVMTYPL